MNATEVLEQEAPDSIYWNNLKHAAARLILKGHTDAIYRQYWSSGSSSWKLSNGTFIKMDGVPVKVTEK